MQSKENYAEWPDHELMRLTADGDEKAFETLVLRYREEALRYCLTLRPGMEQAEDIVQDSFVDIYLQRDGYRREFSFRTYLYAIIRHKTVDFMRKSGRQKLLEELEAQKDSVVERSLEEKYLEQEEQEKLAEWIGELPEHQRMALYLFCVEGFSYQEIADRMEKSTAQVRIWIYRARKRLQKRRMEER